MSFTRKNHGNSHSYYVDGVKIPGVTTIIGVLSKDALVGWAAKTTATYAVENWDRLAGMTVLNRFEEISAARYKTQREAAVRGNRIHALGEKLATGEPFTGDDRDLRSAAEAYVALLDEWELEPVALEMSCYNRDYQYAGTADGVFESPRLGRVIVDIKTGKKAYSEVALQLAAYRYSDIYLEEVKRVGPRGGKLKSDWIEKPMPTVDGAAVIHIERETDESPARARLLPVQANEEIWEQFLYLREIHAGWVERTSWDNRKSPSYSPPIGGELHPEMSDEEIQEAIQR